MNLPVPLGKKSSLLKAAVMKVRKCSVLLGEEEKARDWGIFQCSPINFYFVPLFYLPKNLEYIVPFRIAAYRNMYGKFFTGFLCPEG